MTPASPFSDTQRRMMLHAIGASEGKGVYRNRYVLNRGGEQQTDWDDLVARGFAGFEDMPPIRSKNPDEEPTPSKQRVYWVTDEALFHPELHRGQKPVLVSSMYFAFDGKQRPDVTAKTTFDAILLGQRSSTTRFRKWPGSDKWASKEPGTLVRFHSDKICKSPEYVDVVVTAVENIDLRWCSSADRDRWSRCEGWEPYQGQVFGIRNGSAVWVHYKLLSMSPAAEQRLERVKKQIELEADAAKLVKTEAEARRAAAMVEGAGDALEASGTRAIPVPAM